MVLDGTNGNVGIGPNTDVVNSYYNLSVSGGIDVIAANSSGIGINVAAGGIKVTAGDVNVNGSVTASQYFHNSDMRLKTDIHPISHALDKLLTIRGVDFKWKKDNRDDMGVVAQNVAEAFPYVVRQNNDGFETVEYDSLVGPVIEAIRELDAQNKALNKQVSDLHREIDSLRSEMVNP
jgi:hypothetical protein